MLLRRIVECLYYLVLFIVLVRLSEAVYRRTEEDTTSASPLRTTIPATPTKQEEIRRAFADCHVQFSWLCFKIKVVKLLERLMDHEELHLMTGVSVVRVANATEHTTAEIMAEVARSYPNDANLRLNGLIFAKLEQFLQSHYLRVKLLDTVTGAESGTTSVETGRKGKHKHKKHGGMETVIAAAVMMKATLLVIAGGAVAMLAGKALMTSLMALTVSGMMSMKGSHHGSSHKSTTYEIVAKPVYTSSQSHSVDDGGHTATGYGGSFARSLQLEMPTRRQRTSFSS